MFELRSIMTTKLYLQQYFHLQPALLVRVVLFAPLAHRNLIGLNHWVELYPLRLVWLERRFADWAFRPGKARNSWRGECLKGVPRQLFLNCFQFFPFALSAQKEASFSAACWGGLDWI